MKTLFGWGLFAFAIVMAVYFQDALEWVEGCHHPEGEVCGSCAWDKDHFHKLTPQEIAHYREKYGVNPD